MTQRKYFGTDGIRGKVGESLINPEFVLKLGWAVGKVLAAEGRGGVLIGKDTRISGYMLESALEAGLSAAGVDIHLLGPMPTPAIAYLTRTLRARAGIVISASHNHFEDNGIKFFSAQGEKLPDEVELAIEEHLDQKLQTVGPTYLGKAARIVDAPGRYIEFCKSTIPTNTRLNGMKIIIDCANGATYHIAGNVFRELGAKVIELSIDPDGFNINADCGSTKPELLQQAVVAEKADLGIALDGDGDRVIMVDHTGEILDGDDLLFIIAKDSLNEKRLRGGVIGSIMSNLGLEIALKQLGIEFARSNVGDRYVLAELNKRGWQLGGETSGHIICLDKTTTGDGIIAALQVLLAVCNEDCSLHEVKAGLVKFPQVRIDVPSDDSAKVVACAAVQTAVRDLEGQLKNDGRILLRSSGTEPVVRVMVEGKEASQVSAVANQLAEIVAANQ